MSDVFRIDVSTERGRTRVTVSGVIDEHADLTAVEQVTGKVIEIDFAGVRRINSFGVRLWLNAMKKLQAPGVRIGFRGCPSVVVDQINMVHGFLGDAEVISIMVPRLCEACDRTADQPVEVASARAAGGVIPEFPCPGCGEPMELDDVEHRYRLLLSLPTRGG